MVFGPTKRRNSRSSVVALWIALHVLIGATAWADVSRARAAMAAYATATEASGEAQNRNDTAGFAKHQEAAQAALDEACRQFAAAGADSSDDMEILRDYAKALMLNGDYDLAAAALTRLTENEPDDAEGWFQLGQAFVALGGDRADEAARALRTAFERASEAGMRADVCTVLGRLYVQQGLYALGREQFEKALTLQPGHAGAVIALAGEQVRAGQVTEASAALDGLGMTQAQYGAQIQSAVAQGLQGFADAKRWFSDTGANHTAYARLLFRAGRYPEALDAAERAAVLAPEDYAVLNFIGDLAGQLGKKDRARAAYTRSLEINPDQPRTREGLDRLRADPMAAP